MDLNFSEMFKDMKLNNSAKVVILIMFVAVFCVGMVLEDYYDIFELNHHQNNFNNQNGAHNMTYQANGYDQYNNTPQYQQQNDYNGGYESYPQQNNYDGGYESYPEEGQYNDMYDYHDQTNDAYDNGYGEYN